MLLNGSQVGTDTASPFVFTGMDCGATFTLGVQAHDGSGNTSPVYTTSYTTPACSGGGSAPANTIAPYFCGVSSGIAGCSSATGSAVTGQILTVSQGTWVNSPTGFSYQWDDCTTTAGQPPTTASCSPISGATSASYTVVSGDTGHAIVPIVTASNASGSASTSVAGSCHIGSTAVDAPTVAAGCSPITAVAASSAAGEKFCTNAPVTCGFPDPLSGNVGVPPGTSLTSVGSINCTSTTINAKVTTGSVTIGSNCTIENSKLTGSNSSNAFIVIGSSPTNVQFINDDIAGTYTGTQMAPVCNVSNSYSNGSGNFGSILAEGNGGNVTIDHSYLHCGAEPVNGNAQITNSYLVTNEAWTGSGGPTHNEAAYISGGCCSTGSLVSNDVLLNPVDNTAGLFGDDHAFGPISNLTVTGNLVAVGSAATNGTITTGNTGDGNTGVVITNNRLSAIFNATIDCHGNSAATSLSGNISDATLGSQACT